MQENELQTLIQAEKNAIVQHADDVVAQPVPAQVEPAPVQKVETGDLIEQGIGFTVVQKIQTDVDVQERIGQTANKMIDNKLVEKANETERQKKEQVFKNNKDACDLYGIDEKTVPVWVVQCAKGVQNFWYFIWLIVGFFTTAPVVFLSKKIAVVFKKTWVAVLLAIIIYGAVVTSPLWWGALQKLIEGGIVE